MRRVLWYGWFCWLLSLAPGWAADYQVVDLGQWFFPTAISASGEIVGYRLLRPMDPDEHSVGILRRADGTEVALASEVEVAGSRLRFDVVHPMGIAGPFIVGTAGCGCNFPRLATALQWDTSGRASVLAVPGTAPGRQGSVQALGVNAGGIVAGWARMADPAALPQPIAWIAGQPLVLGPQGTTRAINASGVIVGEQDGHATRWTAAGATRLDTPDTLSSVAWALNDGGTITGGAEVAPGETQAFVWLKTTGFQLLPLPDGDLESTGRGVRWDGVVFGNSWNDFAGRVVRWYAQGGQMVVEDLQPLLDTPGWVLQWMSASNAAGAIVGLGTRQGEQRAFLLQPLPTDLAAR